MSTSGQFQQSSTATYNQAIQLLEGAQTQMTQIQGQVTTAKANLQSRYGGVDGQAYSEVMRTWLEEVDRIKSTCEAMQNQLNISLRRSAGAQSGALDAVHSQGRLTPFAGGAGGGGGAPAGDGAYAAMMGK
ncbi:hypothetical protein ACWD3J_39985 [Streptomyces sp. NPDC002755]